MRSMLQREPDRDDENLRRLTSAEGAFVGVATFSPVPWFGFNGIQTLALTPERLFVIQVGWALSAGRVRSTPVSQITDVSWWVRRGGRAVSLKFRGAGRAHRMTSKYEEGLQLAKTLDALVRVT